MIDNLLVILGTNFWMPHLARNFIFITFKKLFVQHEKTERHTKLISESSLFR